MATRVIKSVKDYQKAFKAIQDRLDKITEDVPKTTTQAVADIALDCLGRAVPKAPVDTGDLRGSGYAEVNGKTIAIGNEDGSISVSSSQIQPEGNIIEAEVGFTSPYAGVQEVHVEFEHPKGGQAKYFESTVVEGSESWKNHLVEAGRKGLRGDGS